MIKIICSQCYKIINVSNRIYKSKIARGQYHFFCNKGCYNKYHINKQKVKCINCGKEFYMPKHRLNITKNFYCSRKCRNLRIKLICDYCENTFYKKRTTIKKHNFCSRKCMGAWQSINIVGSKSPSWLGGWEKYYGSNWKKQKNQARKRDNYTCQLCFIHEEKRAFDVHHRIPFRIYGINRYEEANSLENLITLCQSCHSKIEGIKSQNLRKIRESDKKPWSKIKEEV